MQFVKAEGLGNDFIIISKLSIGDADVSSFARKICERRTGIGADGLLIYEALTNELGSYQMRIFNADGSEAEISGNGLRCLAAHLCAGPELKGDRLWIRTASGEHPLELVGSAHPTYWFLVDMGPPILDRWQMDFKGSGDLEMLTRCTIPLGKKVIEATITSIGNPHCTVFVDAFDQMDWEELGREIEMHVFFPKRTNVEFVRVVDGGNIEVRFWERGVGKTLSSGTGASAAVVASILNGFTESQVVVHTSGGILEIHWREDKHVYLKGPARIVCQGEYYVS